MTSGIVSLRIRMLHSPTYFLSLLSLLQDFEGLVQGPEVGLRIGSGDVR